MNVLVCGDRYWDDRTVLEQELDTLHSLNDITCVIEGEAPGADSMAREWAEAMGIPVMKFPAHWEELGKRAGPIRNAQMLDEGKPDLVVAFHDFIDQSKGTGDMVKKAKAAGVPVVLFMSS
jgi:hypothetical protein